MAREQMAVSGGWRPVTDVGSAIKGPFRPVFRHAEIVIFELGAEPGGLA